MSTKLKILKVALELFHTKGYDKTSVNAIIQAAEISKGGFYHYFASKEDLMNEISITYAEKVTTIFEHISKDERLNACEKLNVIFDQIFTQKSQNFDERVKMVELYKSGKDIRFKNNINKSIINLVKAKYLLIIEQGLKEGIFDTENKSEVSEMLPKLGLMLNEEILDVLDLEDDHTCHISVIKRKIYYYESMFNEMLGCKKERIHFAENAIKCNIEFVTRYMKYKEEKK